MRVVPSSLLTASPKTRIVSPHLVAGKAPWQTVRYACRLARCACRSSSQKVLRYFLGALYTRASFPLRGKPCIEPCSELLTVLYKIPPLAALGRDDRERVVTTGRAGGDDKCGRAGGDDKCGRVEKRRTPLIRRLRRHLPPRGKARAGARRAGGARGETSRQFLPSAQKKFRELDSVYSYTSRFKMPI